MNSSSVEQCERASLAAPSHHGRSMTVETEATATAVVPPLPRKRYRRNTETPSRLERLLAALIAICGIAGFSIAARISPYDASGRPLQHGSHQQLGLPPCTLLSTLGFRCPSCGMTTAVSLLVHGDIVASCQANWAGTLMVSVAMPLIAWMTLLACGMRRGNRFSAENTILSFTVAGATAMLVQYTCSLASALSG